MEKELKEKLFNKKENGWKTVDTRKKEEIFKISENYMNFLNQSKTEREFVKEARKLADSNGFKDIMEFSELKPGDKIYFVNREKSMYLAIIGEEPIENGMHIIGSHIDSPRLDLKPNPLYEDTELAYFKTHYYGGIKKYQWTTIPLSIHGVIVKTIGEIIEINIEENQVADCDVDASGMQYIIFSKTQNQYSYKNGSIYRNRTKIASNIDECNFIYDTNTKIITVNLTINGKTFNTNYTVVK